MLAYWVLGVGLFAGLLMLVAKPVGFVQSSAQDVRLLVQRDRAIDVCLDVPRFAALEDFVTSFLKATGVQHGAEGKHTPHAAAIIEAPI